MRVKHAPFQARRPRTLLQHTCTKAEGGRGAGLASATAARRQAQTLMGQGNWLSSSNNAALLGGNAGLQGCWRHIHTLGALASRSSWHRALESRHGGRKADSGRLPHPGRSCHRATCAAPSRPKGHNITQWATSHSCAGSPSGNGDEPLERGPAGTGCMYAGCRHEALLNSHVGSARRARQVVSSSAQ